MYNGGNVVRVTKKEKLGKWVSKKTVGKSEQSISYESSDNILFSHRFRGTLRVQSNESLD